MHYGNEQLTFQIISLFTVAQRSTSFCIKDVFLKCWCRKWRTERKAFPHVCECPPECLQYGRTLLHRAPEKVLHNTHLLLGTHQSLPVYADWKEEAVGFCKFNIINLKKFFFFCLISKPLPECVEDLCAVLPVGHLSILTCPWQPTIWPKSILCWSSRGLALI